MKAYTELVAEVLQDCQQAPEPLVARAARNVVMDFCERTKVIRRTLDLITLQPDTATYVLTPPENTTIVQVMRAQINELSPLIGTSQDQLDLWWSNPARSPINWNCCLSDCETNRGDSWQQLTQTYPSCYYIDKDQSDYRMRLVGIPTETLADALSVNVALKPSRTSTQIDDWFIEDHYLRLINGVKAKMLLVPKKPWSDPQLGAYYSGMFEEDVNTERKKALRDFIRDDESTGRVRSWY